MLRLISLILLFGGLAVTSYGGLRLYERAHTPTEEGAVSESQPFRDHLEAGDTRPSSTMNAGEDVVRIARAGARRSDVVDRLRTVPIAHETPSRARFNRAFEVTVAIDATGDDTAADALPGRGNVVEGEAQVAAKAQATLSGSAFEIELVSPSVQTISHVTENVWRWRVTPLETGMQELRIELFALEDNDALPVRTFTDRVEVRVSRLGQVLATADSLDPVFMILGGAGSLLAGLFGVLRFFRRR